MEFNGYKCKNVTMETLVLTLVAATVVTAAAVPMRMPMVVSAIAMELEFLGTGIIILGSKETSCSLVMTATLMFFALSLAIVTVRISYK